MRGVLNKKINIYVWELDLVFLFVFLIGVLGGSYLILSGKIISSAQVITTWSQTDWSGGVSGDIVTGTVNTYSAETDIDTASTPGQFILQETADWPAALSDWSLKRQITFDNTTANLGVGSENLQDFQVLIKLEDGVNIDYTQTQNAGQDIKFTDTDGTILYHEIEEWDEGGTSYIWVRVPQIDADSNTDYINMYYGNDGAADGQAPCNTGADCVWDDSYIAVWHLNQTVGDTLDSSPNGYNSSTTSVVQQGTATGQINGAYGFNGNNDYVSFGQISEMESGPTTFSALLWFNRDRDIGNDDTNHRVENVLLANSSNNSNDNFELGTDGQQIDLYLDTTGGDRDVHFNAGIQDDTWYQIAVTFDPGRANEGQVYLDGVRVYQDTQWGNKLDAATNTPFTLGLARPNGSFWGDYDGFMDNVRLSTNSFSDAWLAASYLSESTGFTTYGAEETKYPDTSSITSNIYDASVPSDWTDISFTTSLPANTVVRARSAVNDDMSDAEQNWNLCDQITSGSTLSDNNCIDNTDQYFQYRVELSPDGATSPIFTEINISHTPSDLIAPPTNATNIAIADFTDGDWYPDEATITWTAGEDDPGGTGILGYCVSLDESTQGAPANLDPSIAGGKLTGIDDSVVNDYCPFIATGESIDLSSLDGLELISGQQYYFSIKAVDITGNIWTGAVNDYQNLISFIYDGTNPEAPDFITLPANFISTEDVTITWPFNGAGSASDEHSGLAGLQYRIGENGTWYGDLHNGNEDITDVLANDGSYTTDETYDYPVLEDGFNFIYFRAIDNVGNVSPYVQGVLKLNTIAPSSVQNLVASPTDSTTNSYAFSWDVPDSFNGLVNNITYCYTVNVVPSVNNCNYTAPGATSLNADAFATQPGVNTMYVVARDEALNINYDTYSSTTFSYSGSAPGIPQNLEIADISIRTTKNWRLVLSWDPPQDVGDGIDNYEIYRSTTGGTCANNPNNFTRVGVSNSTSYIDSNLEQVEYTYCIKACDSANSCSAYTDTVFDTPTGRFTEPALLLSEPTVTSITTRRATINWVTDRNSDSNIQFGLASGEYFDEEISNSDQVTSHNLTINNLDPGTTYFYRALWTDEDGNTGFSEEKSFTTDPPPTVSGITATNVGIDSAFINFTVSGANRVTVLYGTNRSLANSESINTGLNESSYSILLENLSDDSEYFYQIELEDKDGFTYTGIDLSSFRTLPRPTILNVEVEELGNSAQPTVALTWESNTPISSIISYFEVGNEAETVDEVQVERKVDHYMEIVGLLPNTRYNLIVRGRDVIGNEATSDTYTFTTSADSRPPKIDKVALDTQIQAYGVATDSLAQIIVSWETDEPATSQVQYDEGTAGIYSQSTAVESNLKQKHLMVISNLRPASVYHLRIRSNDEAGNESVSKKLVVVTAQASDDPLELVIGRLSEIFGFLR